MIDRNKEIKVRNRNNGSTGYQIPEMNVNRQFSPDETKILPYGEIAQLMHVAGGEYILRELLVIEDEEAAAELLGSVEPEYKYTTQDIERLILSGSLDEFLDCLDFAPSSVIDQLKDLAVSLPITDINKAEAIKKKTGFDVLKAIEIKNTKFDGEEDKEEDKPQRRIAKKATRRVVVD